MDCTVQVQVCWTRTYKYRSMLWTRTYNIHCYLLQLCTEAISTCSYTMTCILSYCMVGYFTSATFLVIMRQKAHRKLNFFSFQIIPMWYYKGRTNWMAVQRLGNYWYTSARATRNSLCLVQIHIHVYCTVICVNFVVKIINFMQNYLHKIFFTY